MNQLSVVLARLPFTNQIDYKIRPALVISNKKFNDAHNFFWVCPITSQQTLPEFETEINGNQFEGELRTQSFIRTDTIASLEKVYCLKEIGKISPELFEKVKKELNKNL